MDVTVVVCTYNRAESVARTLDTLCEVTTPAGLQWEIVLVDNNSSDGTPDVCRSYAATLPLRYVFEPCQGKSIALNSGIAVARGALVLFTDDDVDVGRGWIEAYWQAAQRHPGATYFGGRTFPRWETPPPEWLAEHATGLLSCISLHNDGGDRERVLRGWELPVRGCNMAIRREAFVGGVRFDAAIGPRGGSEDRGEETAVIEGFLMAGRWGVYVPEAVVHHRNGPSRMTEAYVRRWFKAAGAVEVRRGALPGRHHVLGAPRYYWRKAVCQAGRYLLSRWICSSEVWLKAEMDMARNWGRVCEWRARRRSTRVDSGLIAGPLQGRTTGPWSGER